MSPPAIENILRDFVNAIVSPFTDLLGDWFWAIIFSVIIGAVYIKTESPGPPAALMLVIGTLMMIVLDSSVRYFFGIMAALGATAAIIYAFRGHD